jgi:hypothetical protein
MIWSALLVTLITVEDAYADFIELRRVVADDALFFDFR